MRFPFEIHIFVIIGQCVGTSSDFQSLQDKGLELSLLLTDGMQNPGVNPTGI
jgi:hypothetical protein